MSKKRNRSRGQAAGERSRPEGVASRAAVTKLASVKAKLHRICIDTFLLQEVTGQVLTGYRVPIESVSTDRWVVVVQLRGVDVCLAMRAKLSPLLATRLEKAWLDAIEVTNDETFPPWLGMELQLSGITENQVSLWTIEIERAAA